LINDIIKYGFFQSNNYENFALLHKNLKIPSGLVSNLENEYILEGKIKDMEDRKRLNKLAENK
jgi:hypothetical protein